MQPSTRSSVVVDRDCAPPQIPSTALQVPLAGAIVGFVADSAHACAIPGAVVDLHFDSTADVRSSGIRAVADSGGGFKFTGVIPGKYGMIVRLFGFRRQLRSLEVSGGKVDTVIFRLSEASFHHGGRVITPGSSKP